MKNELVAVFGGGGFLGSHVADALSEAGHKVRIFDKKPSPYVRAGQEMIVGDLMDLEAVKNAAKGCSCVFNFAGIADIGEARERPLETATVNVVGNTHVLEAARLAGVKRFMFASTVYVFSEAGSFYRASKQACERFVEAYREQYGLDYTILRYGSLYGRRANEFNAIQRFLRDALEKKSIHYAGSPEAMREYIHVKDAARLSVQALAPEYVNRHIIVTGNERLSVKALLSMVTEMLPHQVEVTYSNSHEGGHYVMTPYSFNPKIGVKLTSNEFIDIGQGLLDCLGEAHELINERRL